jgi:hypothetical protein
MMIITTINNSRASVGPWSLITNSMELKGGGKGRASTEVQPVGAGSIGAPAHSLPSGIGPTEEYPEVRCL